MAVGLFASPDKAKESFLARNIEVKEAVVMFGLTSIERERHYVKMLHFSVIDNRSLMFDLGKKVGVSKKSEIPAYLEVGHKAELAYLDKLSLLMPKDGYLFLLETNSKFGAYGYLILTEDKTIYSGLSFFVGHELKIN